MLDLWVVLQCSGLDGAMWYRPNELELQKIGPDVSEQWASFYAHAPDKPVTVVALLSG